MYNVTGTKMNPAVRDIPTLMRAKIIAIQKYFKAINNGNDINSRRVVRNFSNGNPERLFLIKKK